MICAETSPCLKGEVVTLKNNCLNLVTKSNPSVCVYEPWPLVAFFPAPPVEERLKAIL